MVFYWVSNESLDFPDTKEDTGKSAQRQECDMCSSRQIMSGFPLKFLKFKSYLIRTLSSKLMPICELHCKALPNLKLNSTSLKFSSITDLFIHVFILFSTKEDTYATGPQR